ncbi:MAG: hypothetical protein ASARMPREDX12_004628 [Alectoria sarmentosa]|nr:MAG: hypothetical protein ASARMPREDX12_004628 [Alectoria sarmentosa]
MHKYATMTTEARELVSELETTGQNLAAADARSYASIGGPSGIGSADEDDGGGGLRMLRPVSDGDEEEDEGEEFEETRGGPFDDKEAVMAVAGQSRDLDVRN